MAQYEYRMCKKCGYVLHEPAVIKGWFGIGRAWLGWKCLVCGKQRKDESLILVSQIQ